jgi:ribosome maturation factor RimP
MALRSNELRNRIRTLVEPTIERLGFELVAVEVYGGAARRALLRLTLDRAGGVGIEECSRVSRAVSPLLDVEDLIIASYDLEVSSPGMERPLQRIQDFERFQNCTARIRLFPGVPVTADTPDPALLPEAKGGKGISLYGRIGKTDAASGKSSLLISKVPAQPELPSKPAKKGARPATQAADKPVKAPVPPPVLLCIQFSVEDIDRANLELTHEQFARMGEGLPPISEGESQ